MSLRYTTQFCGIVRFFLWKDKGEPQTEFPIRAIHSAVGGAV